MLAAFECHRVATLAAHVLGGADAVGGVVAHGVQGGAGVERALASARHAAGVGGHPAFDDAVHAKMCRERGLFNFACKRLQRAGVVGRAAQHEGLPGAAKGVQVQEGVVRSQPRAQHVGDAALKVLRGVRLQSPVEVALTRTSGVSVGQRVAHRHHRERAARQLPFTTRQLSKHALNAACAAGFVAMHSAGDDELGAGVEGRELVCLQISEGRAHGVKF